MLNLLSLEILNLNLIQRGYCFELLVKLYLLTEPIYKHEFSNVWIDSSFESPTLRNKKILHLDTEEGVDLVCKKANSEEYYCAVQIHWNWKQSYKKPS